MLLPALEVAMLCTLAPVPAVLRLCHHPATLVLSSSQLFQALHPARRVMILNTRIVHLQRAYSPR